MYNLSAFNKLEDNGSERIINVYKANSRKELTRCITALKRLMERVHWLKEKWPEVTVLDDIRQVNFTPSNHKVVAWRGYA